MTKWVLLGLRTGTKTTQYPGFAENAPGVSPGRPRSSLSGEPMDNPSVHTRCPTRAINQSDYGVSVDYRRCVHCFRCHRGLPAPLDFEPGYEWASLRTEASDPSMMLGHVFAHSIHVRVLDAGACRACLSEIEQLGKPYYNVHRLGFFITPTPRQADVLLVAGPVTDNMRLPLQKTYDAMPTPKKVIAAGTCALSGGVFGPSFTCEAGVSKVIPVDVEITGCPPPPLALIHGLLVVAGRQSGKLPVPARELKGGQRDD